MQGEPSGKHFPPRHRESTSRHLGGRWQQHTRKTLPRKMHHWHRGDRQFKIGPQFRLESAAQRFMMTANVARAQNATLGFEGQPNAARGLALVRMTIGAMFVSVF